MKELSIFIDESGDFATYNHHSPWYIVAMVFHDQNNSIREPMEYLERELARLGLANHCIHTGPIIRKEEDMVEHMPTKISHLNLSAGCLRDSSFI